MQRDASTHQSRGIPITSATTTIPPPSPLPPPAPSHLPPPDPPAPPPQPPFDDRRTPSWRTVVWPFGAVEVAFLQAAGPAIMLTSVSPEYPVDDAVADKEPEPPTPLKHTAHTVAKDRYSNKHSKLAIGTARFWGRLHKHKSLINIDKKKCRR